MRERRGELERSAEKETLRRVEDCESTERAVETAVYHRTAIGTTKWSRKKMCYCHGQNYVSVTLSALFTLLARQFPMTPVRESNVRTLSVIVQLSVIANAAKGLRLAFSSRPLSRIAVMACTLISTELFFPYFIFTHSFVSS